MVFLAGKTDFIKSIVCVPYVCIIHQTVLFFVFCSVANILCIEYLTAESSFAKKNLAVIFLFGNFIWRIAKKITKTAKIGTRKNLVLHGSSFPLIKINPITRILALATHHKCRPVSSYCRVIGKKNTKTKTTAILL